jgi:translation initiation factor IF-1
MNMAVERDRLEMDGVVIEANKSIFKVRVGDDHIVTATLSGKIRQNSVKILVADLVTVEVSPYDLTKGRIVYRHKKA